MALKKITAADFNAAIKKLTTSDASVWWKTLGKTEEGTELCFVMGWNDGYDEDDEDTMYQKDGYTLCTKIGYKPSNLMVMDYTDFNMPYDKKTADVWDTDMSVGKGEVTDDAFDVKWYNDEAQAIWKKYGKPNKEGTTALDLMESKKKEAKKHTCSMQKKKESVSKKNESSLSHFVVSNAEIALDTVCDEILSHTNDDFVIHDADAAEIVGKYAIMRELDGFGGYSGTADEFADWVDSELSGSPLDGSPFGSAEATEYARKVWSEED